MMNEPLLPCDWPGPHEIPPPMRPPDGDEQFGVWYLVAGPILLALLLALSLFSMAGALALYVHQW